MNHIFKNIINYKNTKATGSVNCKIMKEDTNLQSLLKSLLSLAQFQAQCRVSGVVRVQDLLHLGSVFLRGQTDQSFSGLCQLVYQRLVLGYRLNQQLQIINIMISCGNENEV